MSELTRLTLDDLELPELTGPGTKNLGAIRINGGVSRQSRVVPLNSKACVALAGYLAVRLPVSPLLFLNRFKRPLGPRGIQKIVYKYSYLANVPTASVHSLRHTFGVQHAAKGTSLTTIQEVLGHQDIRTTEIYVPLARDLISKEMQENAL